MVYTHDNDDGKKTNLPTQLSQIEYEHSRKLSVP